MDLKCNIQTKIQFINACDKLKYVDCILFCFETLMYAAVEQDGDVNSISFVVTRGDPTTTSSPNECPLCGQPGDVVYRTTVTTRAEIKSPSP